jgi:hypothetical protein
MDTVTAQPRSTHGSRPVDARSGQLFFAYMYNTGHAVAQLIEALRYKPEDRGIDSWWCHWIFSLT